MKRSWRCVPLAAIGASVLVVAQSTSALASTAPGLGTAASFAILAGTTVTNNLAPSSTIVTGDLGVSPGTAVTNMAGGSSGTLHGTQHTGTDPVAISAKNDLVTAYGVAASSPCNFNKTGANLGGLTLTPGTYCQTTAPTLTGTLTLSGNGVFIFQVGSTLVTAPGATVQLINGAQACNVFWQVGSSATLDTTTTFVGTIMALANISLNDSASLAGRALAQTGQVSMINNLITAPTSCAAPTVFPSPAPTAPPKKSAPVPLTPRTGTGSPVEPGLPWILIVGGVSVAIAGATGLRLRPIRQGRR